MKNYREASAVTGGSQIVAVRNPKGNIEVFTIGSDNTVWNIYPDQGSDTGYGCISTGMKAEVIAAHSVPKGYRGGSGDINENCIIIFGASDISYSYAIKDTSGSPRWIQPGSPKMTGIDIAQILTWEADADLFIALNMRSPWRSPRAPLNLDQIGVARFGTDLTTYKNANPNSVYLHGADNKWAIASFGGGISYISDGSPTRTYNQEGHDFFISADATTDSKGDNQIFVVKSDNNVYHLTLGEDTYSTLQLSQGVSFGQVMVGADINGNVHVFAVSTDKNLYHFSPQPDSPTGYSAPLNIQPNVVSAAVASNNSGVLNLFAVSGGENPTITHLFLQEISTNWQAQLVEVSTDGVFEEYNSYSTDVIVKDSDGTLMVNCPVTVTASEETRMTINGATYLLDSGRPTMVSTDSIGMLSLVQETGTLSVPALQLDFTSTMPNSPLIAVRQAEVVQVSMYFMKGSDLMDAKDAGGNYLLQGNYRKADTAQSVASVLKKCAELTSASPVNATSLKTEQGQNIGAFSRPSGSAADLNLIAQPAVEQHWHISFDGQQASYRELAPDEASSLLAGRAALPLAVDVLGAVLETTGDVVRAVSDGTAKVKDGMITAVAAGQGAAMQLKAEVTLLVNNLESKFTTIITSVEQAFGIAEMCLAEVGITFEKTVEWLGYVFDWPDIVRTHEAIIYTVNQFIGFLEGSASNIQKEVSNGLDAFQSQWSELYTAGIESQMGFWTIGQYAQNYLNSNSQITDALSNNIIYNKFIEHMDKPAPPVVLAADAKTELAADAKIDSAMAGAETDPSSQTIQTLQTFTASAFAADTDAGKALAQMQIYFKTIDSSEDLTSKQIGQLIGYFIQVVGSGFNAIPDALMQQAQNVILKFKELLNQNWDIPFISKFYTQRANGANLTPLNLCAFMAAIPVTAFYKSTKNAAPFPNQNALTAFTNSFNAQSMIRAAFPDGDSASHSISLDAQAMQSGPEPEAQGKSNNHNTGLLPTEGQTLLGILGTCSTCINGLVTAINDYQPTAPKGYSIASYILEIISQASSFPWFYSSGKISSNYDNPDGCGRLVWLIQNVGVVMDGLFLTFEGRITENTNDTGVITQSAYALIHTQYSVMASVKADDLTRANLILPLIPELAKILRLRTLQNPKTLVVLAVIDGSCYFASGIVNFECIVKQTSAETT
jgi:hypothetical protein